MTKKNVNWQQVGKIVVAVVTVLTSGGIMKK